MTFETADVTDSDIHRTRKMSVISMVDSRKDSTGEYSPPANDSPSNERSNDNNKVWLYEENNKKLYTMDGNPSRGVFLDEFFEYRRKRGLYCKIPVIARKPLDVFVLYNIVQKYGGFEQTLKNRMWSQIARELDLPRTMTSGAFTLKLKYIRLLYQFECHVIGKPVNQSILLNDAFIGETPNSSEQSETQSEYMMRTRLDATSPRATSLPSSPPSGVFSRSDSYHSTEEQGAYTEYTRAKTEKEYRDALMGAYGGQKRKESSNGNGYTTKVNGRNDSDGAYPYYIREQRPHKRPSLDYRQSNSPHLLKRKMLDSPPPPPPSSAPRRSVSLANFSVDVLQVGEGKISLKVLMNNEIYEGELFSITPDSPYST